MELLFKLVIPVILILSPTVFQIEFTSKRIKGKTHLSIFIICLLTFVIGIPVSAIATWFSTKDDSNSINTLVTIDDMSSLILFVFGIGINLIMIFFVGIIGLFIWHKSRRT
jgi:hypothetical protein